MKNIDFFFTKLSMTPVDQNTQSQILFDNGGYPQSAVDLKVTIYRDNNKFCYMYCRSLVDTVYALKDEVRALQYKISTVSVQLEEEKSAREHLQCIVHSLLTSSSTGGHGGIDSSLQYLALHN